MVLWYGSIAHHAVGVGVARLWDGQALDDFGGHPGERPHHRHVSGVREELGRTEVTDLKSQQWQRWWKPKLNPFSAGIYISIRIKTQTFRTLSSVMTTVGQRTESKYEHTSVCAQIFQSVWLEERTVAWLEVPVNDLDWSFCMEVMHSWRQSAINASETLPRLKYYF